MKPWLVQCFIKQNMTLCNRILFVFYVYSTKIEWMSTNSNSVQSYEYVDTFKLGHTVTLF